MNIKKLAFVLIVFAGGLAGFIVNAKAGIEALIPAIILFAIGFFLLIKGGDWFVDGASAIAGKFKIPEIIIGATVVSIGTTLPEVMVSAQAAAKGNGAISYGNAIGSIICNVALIAAITLAVKPAKADRKSMIVPIIFFFSAAGLYSFTAYVTGNFTRTTGIVLLCMFVVYMVITVTSAIKGKSTGGDEEPADEEEKEDMSVPMALVLLVFGAAVIAAIIIGLVIAVIISNKRKKRNG